MGFPSDVPARCGACAASGKGLRCWGGVRLEVAFSSSASASLGRRGSVSRSPAGPGGRVSPGRCRRAVPCRAPGSRGVSPERAAGEKARDDASCAAAPAPSPRGGGARVRLRGAGAPLPPPVRPRERACERRGGPPSPPRGVRPVGRRRRPAKGRTLGARRRSRAPRAERVGPEGERENG